ncbi:heterokaryon incompatibility protein-domain-containing protein [Rhexocercosporidium sp. MPI-PUGE-AT-0058]|nr:heterokaryon incompatibility protein-domain-containing protein [Rhexocercosporidium sp. MPI-PUGE-AT-0058]
MHEDEIRILDILPCSGSSTQASIQCEVRVVRLSDKPFYDALSYRWGNPECTQRIKVDEQWTCVTDNLYAALIRLRRENEKRTIWIDQLCIDQLNMGEKVEQIRLMRQIYSNCNRCLIWMDEIHDDVSQADAESSLDVLSWMADSSLPVPPCLASTSTFQGPIYALKSIGVDDHPWWERIWTVQEVILPSNKVFLWGSLQLPWNTLTRCTKVWTSNGPPGELHKLVSRNHTPDLTDIIERTMGWLFCNVIWINGAHAGQEEPVQVFMKWRGRKASEPRDKIFGLLGLLPSAMELRYTKQCDYETPTEEVYCAFMLDMILYDGGLLPLAVQERLTVDKGSDNLPAWVSHMDDREMPHQVGRFYRRWGYETYDACAGQQLHKKALTNEVQAAKWQSPMRTLGLTGVAVDTIALIGTKLLGPQGSAKIAETVRSWMDMASKYHDTLVSGSLGDAFKKVFYKVLVNDRVRNGEHWVVRRPNWRDLNDVSSFIQTGEGTINYLDSWGEYTCNQTFFVTKNGMMGMGHLETEVGDEVWVFDGGRMPFTIRKRENESEVDFDFVGCCYAYGIMNGEVYRRKKGVSAGPGGPRRTIRLH